MNNKNRWLGNLNHSVRFSIAVAGLYSVPTFAQDTLRNQPTHTIDDVIISASRTPEIKNQAAVTVQIINKKQIEEVSQFNPDVTAVLGLLVPGMGMQSNTTSNRSQTLRGRTPLLLIDGVPQSTPLRLSDRDLRSLDPAVIERIEIIKGATSIYGNGANGGIINIITRHNTSHQPIEGSTTFGYTFHDAGSKMFSRDGGAGYRVTQQLYGQLNKFDYYVSGMMKKTGVMIDGENQVISPRYGLGETTTWNAFAKLGYQIDDNNRLELMYNYFNSQQDSKYIAKTGVYGSTPAIGVLGEHQGVDEGTPYNHNLNLKYINKNIFANTSFTATAYYQNLYTIYDYRSPPRWFTGGQSAIKGEKYGLRFNFDTKADFTDYWKANFTYGVDGLVDRTAQPLVDGRLWVPYLKGTNVAPYLQMKNVFADHFVLKLGARYDYLTVKVPNYNTVPNNNQLVAVKGGNLDYNKMTFNAGFAYTAQKYFQPYVSYSQGFSIYDLGRILRSASENTVSEMNTEPVVTNNYEVGFNSSISNRLTFSGSVFQSVAKLGADLISVDGFWVPERSPQKVWGWEIESQYQPIDQLRLGAAYSWQEGKADTDDNGSYDKYLSGLLIAPAKINLNAAYQILPNLGVSLYYLHSAARNRFATSNGLYAEGEGNVQPIDLFNLNANYAISKQWNVNLGIENLFNKTYYTQISMLNARDAEYARGIGRYVSLTFKYSY